MDNSFLRTEEKWQARWEQDGAFVAKNQSSRHHNFYLLEMFPYPSGKLHMGHLRVYCIGDALAHYYRMKGYNVLHPMGFDAFGLPAENAAIKNKMHPAKWTYANIDEARAQLKRMGISYDWSREVITCHEDYYRWTQWLFLKFYEKGLVYKATDLLNWCETCQTVLANEQVENGSCWRCGNPVGQRETEGWYFKITAYADQLVEDLKTLEGKWPDRILLMQRNWIGKSEGAEIDFPLEGDAILKIYTTRVDTIFGATFMVLAPEHPLSLEVGLSSQEVRAFLDDHRTRDRTVQTAVDTEKRGVFSGRDVLNPATGKRIPVWISNYVVMKYGTGAIMAVPAHDQRDFEFAKKYGLEITPVIQFPGGNPVEMSYEGEGTMISSGEFDGLPSGEAKAKMAEWVERKQWGVRRTQFRLRDWSISRQRFWGEPIPIVYCPTHGEVPLPADRLPLKLPETVEFQGASSPLPNMKEFVETTCPKCGGPARRETQTMDAFVASSWYFARYIDAQNSSKPFDKARAEEWLPVDIYVGGPEHACKHLIYARFFQKVMRDLGMTTASEPFAQLVTQGIVYKNGAKMSKSRGNIVSPDEIIGRYGADTGRLFILFAAPPEIDMEWSDTGVEGAHRFLNRVSRWIEKISAVTNRAMSPNDFDEEVMRVIHTTIKRVTRDIEKERQFNTAISALMECLNMFQEKEVAFMKTPSGQAQLRYGTEIFVKLLVPFAPHLASEAWEQLGYSTLVVREVWPTFDEKWLQRTVIEIPVQINGKLKTVLTVSNGESDDSIRAIALADEKVMGCLEGKTVKKVVVVPRKLINIVAV